MVIDRYRRSLDGMMEQTRYPLIYLAKACHFERNHIEYWGY